MLAIREKKIVATTLVAGISVAMMFKGDFLISVFPLWYLSNLLNDMEKEGKFFPYELSLKPVSIIRNQWFMILVVFVLWLTDFFD